MGRMDLHLKYAGEEFAIELKLFRKDALEQGTRQLTRYLKRLSLDHGYLILFRRSQVEQIGTREELENEGERLSVIYF